MKVPRLANHRQLEKEQSPLSITASSRPTFKISPCLQKGTSPSCQSSCSSPSSTSSTSLSSSSSSSTSSTSLDTPIHTIANTMKLRMKAAINTMICNGNHNSLLATVTSPNNHSQDDPSPITARTSFAPRAPPSRRTLKATNLLKAYLYCIQEETGANLELESSPSSSLLLEASPEHQPHRLASSGASLIESLVHDSLLNRKSYNLTDAMPLSDVPSITSIVSAKRIKKSKRSKRKQEQQQQQQQQQQPYTTKKRPSRATSLMTRCICANSHDEFGSMVQCDDCFYWLHLDCLDLKEDSLGDTFRCPSCSVAQGLGLGERWMKKTNSWRFSAQWESKQRLAASRRKWNNVQQQRSRKRHPTFDTNDNPSDDPSDYDFDLVSTIPRMIIDSTIKTTRTTSTGNVLVQALSRRAVSPDNDPDNDDMDVDILDSETIESDWENEYEPSYQQEDTPPDLCISTTPPLITSPVETTMGDTDSSCEVDTPGGPLDNSSNDTTPVDLMHESLLSSTATMPCLDQESLFWLSHLSYLESLQSSPRRHCFTSHASDVFLCDGDLPLKSKQLATSDQDSSYSFLSPLLVIPSRADPPSTICSNYLSEYSFDEGPFWSPSQ